MFKSYFQLGKTDYLDLTSRTSRRMYMYELYVGGVREVFL